MDSEIESLVRGLEFRVQYNPSDKFIFDQETKEIKSATLMEWAEWFETSDRHVAKEDLFPFWLSTVFLGVDHGFGMSVYPVLFESMAFYHPPKKRRGGPIAYGDRYSTYEEALEGHAIMRRVLSLKIEEARAIAKRMKVSKRALPGFIYSLLKDDWS